MKLKLLLSLSFVLLVLLCVTALAVTGRDGAPPASLELMEGASVRLDPAHPGLRFETRVKTSELKALDEPYEIGTLILPTDLLTGALTVQTPGVTHLFSGMEGVRLREAEDGYTYFYAALTDLLPQNYARRFSAVSYIRFPVSAFSNRWKRGCACNLL